MHLYYFGHLLFAECAVVHEPFEACAEYGEWCLQFVRGVAYEAVLSVEVVFGTFHSFLYCVVEFAEFHHCGCVGEICALCAWAVFVEAFEQGVEWAHVQVVDYGYDCQYCKHEHCVESEYVIGHGFEQVFALEGGGCHLQFVVLSFAIAVYGLQYAGGFCLLLFGYIDHFVVEGYLWVVPYIFFADGDNGVAVVGAVVGLWQGGSNKCAAHYQLGVVAEGIVGLVVYLAYHSVVEEQRP